MPTDVSQINKDHIRAFIGYLQAEAKTPHSNKSLSPATIQGYVRCLKSFFSWLQHEDYTASNIIVKIPVPKAPTKVVNTCGDDQIARLFDVCQRPNGR